MDYTLILRPLIGAVIGYVTNWIAVKMLFRPLNPIKLGKFTLPFTPGIIPKNKERIAESIGLSISENLLTDETLKEYLLKDETQQEIRENVVSLLNNISTNESTIQELCTKNIEENTYNKFINSIIEYFSSSIFETVKKYDLGNIVAKEIEESAKEKLKGSLIGIFGGNSIVASVSETASLKVNNYIDTNGKDLISNMVKTEIDKYTSINISDLAIKVSNSDIDLVEITMNIYKNVVIKKIPDILSSLNIAKIVKDKINSMDMLEVEKLILEIMKKELNALVNLGALIGFILGLVNLLF